MQLTQEQFVADCLAKYWFSDMPSDQNWEEAHFPLPECLGGENTVMLWSADHTVQGLLQSVEFDHQCFHGKANKKDLGNLETHYPEYLELFKQLKSQFSGRRSKKGAATNKANGTGAYHDPKIQSANRKKCAKLKIGIHGQSADQLTVNGKKSAAINKANGTGAFFNPQIQSACGKKGSATTNAQRYQCLVTDFISNAGGLSSYQKARGIDTKLRVKLS